MLTKLSQFQAQGWEKWLFRIRFTRRTDSLKSSLRGILLVPKPRLLAPKSSQICPFSNCWLRIWRYIEGSVAVPDLGWENLTTLTLVPSKQRIKPTKLPMTTGKLEVIVISNKYETLDCTISTNNFIKRCARRRIHFSSF
jgi:hypothetical protein